MTDLVPIVKGKPAGEITLAVLQDRLDTIRANEVALVPDGPTSTKKSRIAAAKRQFDVSPVETLVNIQAHAEALAHVFDGSITMSSIPLSRAQVNTLSAEFRQIELLQAQLAALETRYRDLIFAHLDETVPRVPGRPVAQVPGKVEATTPGPHYVFERRGGNREWPDLDTKGLQADLPAAVAAKVFKTVHHSAVEAWDEEIFDQAEFAKLVDEEEIDMELVARHLTPGKWRKPSFYKTLVDGGEK